MTKLTILKKRLFREYNKQKNWEYSRMKGYPEDTYFGYSSFKELKDSVIKQYTEYYGPKLKYWRYT